MALGMEKRRNRAEGSVDRMLSSNETVRELNVRPTVYSER
jgi:hypothetical protein